LFCVEKELSAFYHAKRRKTFVKKSSLVKDEREEKVDFRIRVLTFMKMKSAKIINGGKSLVLV